MWQVVEDLAKQRRWRVFVTPGEKDGLSGLWLAWSGHVTFLSEDQLVEAPLDAERQILAAPPSQRPAATQNEKLVCDTNDILLAPSAARIAQIHVQEGANVSASCTVVTLEAMKMQTRLVAPRAGEVAQILVCVGQWVNLGEVLLRLVP